MDTELSEALEQVVAERPDVLVFWLPKEPKKCICRLSVSQSVIPH